MSPPAVLRVDVRLDEPHVHPDHAVAEHDPFSGRACHPLDDVQP